MGPYKGVCISSVDHSVVNYQCKKGSCCVEITGFQVGGSSVGGARRFSSTRPLTIFEPIRNHDRSMSKPTTTMISKENAMVRNFASTSIHVGPVQKIVLTTSLRVELLLKTDSGYPKDTGVNKP